MTRGISLFILAVLADRWNFFCLQLATLGGSHYVLREVETGSHWDYSRGHFESSIRPAADASPSSAEAA
ncbi:MAG: hypothetical protein IH940_08160 [Acidobacteria bacterium]|nr:hypothetical protein [Acidobacteriota bacterium]